MFRSYSLVGEKYLSRFHCSMLMLNHFLSLFKNLWTKFSPMMGSNSLQVQYPEVNSLENIFIISINKLSSAQKIKLKIVNLIRSLEYHGSNIELVLANLIRIFSFFASIGSLHEKCMNLNKSEGKNTRLGAVWNRTNPFLTGNTKKQRQQKRKKNNVFKSDQIQCRFIYVNRCETNKQHILVVIFFFCPMTTIMAY